ncbi:MAG: hypothetical protein PHO37_12900 [Kiritimatiellae bacterium]|nr:hypothetical protein [Kiritimatiellia bacterium]
MKKAELLTDRFGQNIAGVLNCFISISDFSRAQELAKLFDPEPLHRRSGGTMQRHLQFSRKTADRVLRPRNLQSTADFD